MADLWGFSVYVATNRLNGKVYVGVTSKGVDFRWKTHQRTALRGQTSLFARAITKYGPENFDIREVCRCRTQDDAFSIEMLLIQEHRANGVFLYNMTDGGGGAMGLAEEARVKISQALSGKPKAPETRKKLSDSVKKAWSDPAIKTRMAEAQADPTVRAKMSKARVEYWQHGDNREKSSKNMREAMTPESRARRSNAQKKLQAGPEFLAKKSEAIKAGMTKEATQKISAGQLNSWSNPETRAKRVEAMKNWWNMRKEGVK